MGSASGDEVKITKKFLSEALGDEIQIQSYKVRPGTKPGDNYTSLIYSIEVQFEQKGVSTTRHLLMKCYPTHPARQEMTNNTNMFFKEMEVYRVWMPELRKFQTQVIGLEPNQALKLPYAPYVHGVCIDFEAFDKKEFEGKTLDSLDNFIIMEDIRKTWGYRMTNRMDSLDIDHMRLLVEALAKIHSLSWAYKNHVEMDVKKKFSCLNPNFNKEDLDLWRQIVDKNIDLTVETLNNAFGVGNHLSKATKNFKEIMPKIMDAFIDSSSANTEKGLEQYLRIQNNDKFGKDAPNPEPWRIICHGDCWSNNLLFRYDEMTGKPLDVILVDLQMVQETCVVNDLAYVMYANTSGELRKNHLEELLQLYHDKFNYFCKLLRTKTLPGFTLESFRFRFHRAKLHGFFMANMGLPIMLKEADKAINLDEMEQGTNLVEMFGNVCEGNDGNKIYQKRIIEVTQELYEQGVI